jgi:hypothetical protein
VDQLTGLSMANPDLPERFARTDDEMQALIEKYELAEAPPNQNGLPVGNQESNNDTGIVIDRPTLPIQQELEEKYPLVGADDSSSDEGG